MAATSSYKTKELTFIRRVLRQKTRENEETLREKTLYKGEFGDMKSDALKMKPRCRKNGFTNGGQTRNVSD